MNSNRNGAFVPSSEAERFTLHQTLRGLMPEAVADTLMSYLPPAGWSDVARTSDIVALREATKHDIDELRTATKVQFDQLGAATKHDIDELRTATKHQIDQLATATKHQIDQLATATKVQFDQLGAATKRDIDELRTATKVQFDQLGAATKRDIDELRTATKHDIDDLRERVDRLEVKIDNLASMKRYVVTTGLTLAGLITGFGFAILGTVT